MLVPVLILLTICFCASAILCYSPEQEKKRKSWFKDNPGHVKRFYNYKFKFIHNGTTRKIH